MNPIVLDHPLAHELIANLRDVETSPDRYRTLTHHLTTLLVIEATRGLRTAESTVQTPMETAPARVINQGLGAVPILRAGLGMLQPVLDLFEDVKVGYIGLERNHTTAIAHSYYAKLPDYKDRFVLCLDPMLATGGSASQSLSLIKANHAETVVMVSIIAAPEGIARIQGDHPDVKIVVAAVDRELNPNKYILPGLGDFGDRLNGTGQ
jgi:uracil phosphoribosyltransferase